MPNDRGCENYLSWGICLRFIGRLAARLWLNFFHGTYGMCFASWEPYGNSTKPVGRDYAKRRGEWRIRSPYKASSCLESIECPGLKAERAIVVLVCAEAFESKRSPQKSESGPIRPLSRETEPSEFTWTLEHRWRLAFCCSSWTMTFCCSSWRPSCFESFSASKQ